jgi:hypothetical protein
MPRTRSQTHTHLYERSRTGAWDDALFRDPPAEYRGAPFWSWNCRLDVDRLLRQIPWFKAMGMGGYHIHVRIGLDTPYLSDEFMAAVRACVAEGERQGLLTWLYDEDRWPSGFAGGLVTAEERYRSRHLLFTSRPYGEGETGEGSQVAGARGARQGQGQLLARYGVCLGADGCLDSYRRLATEENPAPDERVNYAYLEVALPSPWFNNATYVDTLNAAAIERFVEVTHERYRAAVGSAFGRSVPAIFTDEPQLVQKQHLPTPTADQDVILLYTDDLDESFRSTYRIALLDVLPEVVWDPPDGRPPTWRHRYHDHVAERFATAFADTVGGWCDAHGLALTGHLMDEPTLASQTDAMGDAMRNYRAFHIPGIDILCDSHEYTTAKQAQSAAHQFGREGVLAELYGVTGWGFGFAGHKGQGDWQAALGVTVRVHHLAWVSMGGSAKRDYPASIFYQSPWYREYPLVEYHFARLNTVLSRGMPRVRIGVIHPVESYWLHTGPRSQHALDQEELEWQFESITSWLLFGLLDFDFVAESLLPNLCPEQSGDRFHVGAMDYEAVVVPGLHTIRSSTLACLEAFADAGGTVIFAGRVPDLVDAEPSDRAHRLAARCKCIPFSRPELLGALEPFRDIAVRDPSGAPADTLVHQMRDEGGSRHLFLCNTDARRPAGQVTVRLRGDWSVTERDTMTGSSRRLACRRDEQWTELDWSFPAHGHLLASLEPGWRSGGADPLPSMLEEVGRVYDPTAVVLSEPNALLLDQVEWRLNDGDWQPREELLRIDGLIRDHLGLPRRGHNEAQPYVIPDDPRVLSNIELRFTVDTHTPVTRPHLAIECPAEARLWLDGTEVPVVDDGWCVDEDIRTVPLPRLAVGSHVLRLGMPFRRKSYLEWAYLLGDFGVEVRGRDASLTRPVRTLAFGDWTSQGLPFYTGNVTYRCELDADGGPVVLQVPRFKGAMIGVALDGERVGSIAFDPYQLDLGRVPPGPHALDLTLFGHRHNAFGPVHWAEPGGWVGPNAWFTRGRQWCYEYVLQPMGILSAPLLLAPVRGDRADRGEGGRGA